MYVDSVSSFEDLDQFQVIEAVGNLEGRRVYLIQSDLDSSVKPLNRITGEGMMKATQLYPPRVCTMDYLKTDEQIRKISREIRPLKTEGSVEVGIEISWGGEQGAQVSGHAQAEVHDDRGNYVEVKAEHDSDGTGKASVSAGHKEE